MTNTNPTVLVVDDEAFNLEILAEYLEDTGYNVISAGDGATAWSLLEETPQRFDAILLDRMMPNMNGMEVLAKIKAHPAMSMLPVILQTAKAAREDVLSGLQAGAYYYLTKPFNKDTILAIVKTAVADYQCFCDLQDEANQTVHTLSLMDKGRFTFQTLEEGRALATLLANATPEAARVVVGLSELMINAVEHGNLGISYDEKSKLNALGDWLAEVNRRMTDPQYAARHVTVSYDRTEDEMHFVIQDQGAGFDWQAYLEINPDRAFDSHGRGIAMARKISFDRLEYQGNGNKVMAVVSLS